MKSLFQIVMLLTMPSYNAYYSLQYFIPTLLQLS